MSAHTPGPWSIHQCGNGSEPFEVKDEHGRKWTAMSRHVGAGETLIAEVQMMTHTEDMGYPRVDNPEECIANARLIAAAPTMYSKIERLAKAGDEEAAQILEAINASR